MKQSLNRFIAILIALTFLSSPFLGMMEAYAAHPQQQSTTKGRRSTSKKKPVSNNRKGASKTTSRKGKASSGRETSADVRKRQEATQKEIRLTEEQIRANERSIKQGLNELGKLETDISTSQAKIKNTTGQINVLTGKINTLENGIAGNQKELERLRDEYLKAVKKMRLAKKNNSDLAFVFASKNFNQALRRMRYLRQFSEWKDRQSAAINNKTEELKSQKEQLAQNRRQQDAMLRLQRAEESTLKQQHARQDAIVAGLRQNGDALKSHLSKKQAEANQLRNRIAALIAAEEKARKEEEERARKAAEEKARKAEEERARKAEEERRAREAEEQARLLAAAEKTQKEEKDAGKAGDMSAKNDLKADSKKADNKKNQAKETKKDKKQDKKNNDKRNKKNNNVKKTEGKSSDKNYADARKRSPRSNASAQASGKKNIASASVGSAAGNFAGMKGRLPRPVSGAFKLTSRFGRQSLPDLPDVVYDNPGIDAEVAAGASALAVYGGKVSGVYMLPGYNTVIIVNHGNYYTVYGNIASPSVKVGDQVWAGQGLGSLAPDEDDRSRSSIHFEVWRNREKLNPLDWIK